MRPNKEGQIAKFHTPFPDEDPHQLYVVLNVREDAERPRADIKALNTGLSFIPTSLVNLNDLVVVEVNTQDLIGYQVYIKKNDSTIIAGKVASVFKPSLMLDLCKSSSGVETNVLLTIVDRDGESHTGKLFVR